MPQMGHWPNQVGIQNDFVLKGEFVTWLGYVARALMHSTLGPSVRSPTCAVQVGGYLPSLVAPPFNPGYQPFPPGLVAGNTFPAQDFQAGGPKFPSAKCSRLPLKSISLGADEIPR